MDKKKKIILISVISLVIVLIIIGIIAYVIGNNKKGKLSKVMEFHNMLKEKNEYKCIMKVDDEHEMFYAKKDGKAYIKTKYGENTIENIVRDGNTYFIKRDEECYYTYKNNEIELNKIELALKELENSEYTKGKEKIGNTKYSFEEYKIAIPLTMLDLSTDDVEDFTTRLYFKGKDLKYIKTAKDGKQELLKMEFSNDVDNKLFEIPSNFEER